MLAIVLIAALLGFVLALARQSSHGMFWYDLARTAAFLLWAGLLCAAVLCRSRSWLAGRSLRAGIAWSLLLMVATVAVLSEAVYQLGRLWAARLGTPSAILPDSHWRFVLPNMLIAAVVGALALRQRHPAAPTGDDAPAPQLAALKRMPGRPVGVELLLVPEFQ